MQVFFACSDGSLFSLCPVAPFHAAMSLSAVDQLVEISRCSANDTEHSTTQAWLDQVTHMRPYPPLSFGVHACQLLHLLVTETKHLTACAEHGAGIPCVHHVEQVSSLS